RLAVDASGDLYVADADNNRVLVYNTPFDAASGKPGAGDTIADFVYGQNGSFVTNGCNAPTPNAATLCNPQAIAFDSAGNVYIADSTNNRVIEIDAPLAQSPATTRAFGQQGSFTSRICNGGGVIDAGTLCNPTDVTLDLIGGLYIADANNDRVLHFNPVAGSK